MPKGSRNVNYSGQKFGALNLLEKARDDTGKIWYSCECECGTRLSRRADYLVRARFENLSCGCKHSLRMKTGALSSHWKGHGEIPGHYLAAIRKNAEYRSLAFDLTIEYLWGLFEEQGGRCALSGLEIRFGKGPQRNRTTPQTASLDRRDSALGYVEGNVVWVHKIVNQMKNHFHEEVFLMVCSAAASYRPIIVSQAAIDAVPSTMNQHRKRAA